MLVVVKGDTPKDIVWRVDSESPVIGVRQVTYGVIPPGFVQLVPSNNSPPENLISGQKYSVSGTGDGMAVNAFVY